MLAYYINDLLSDQWINETDCCLGTDFDMISFAVIVVIHPTYRTGGVSSLQYSLLCF